ncbi:MAG TPA: PEP-CTERM sorting domain-containing protein [Chromatiales bacterium]|nr:PEP-CTERM sorting domain-containing protein [Chromatiales bacterium]
MKSSVVISSSIAATLSLISTSVFASFHDPLSGSGSGPPVSVSEPSALLLFGAGVAAILYFAGKYKK